MNISAINDQAFQGKEKQYGAKIIGELGDATNKLYKRTSMEVDSLAKYYKRDVKLQENNGVLFANSGPITTVSKVSDLENSADKFFEFISNNFVANKIAKEQSLKNGLNYLA
ncbi:MAG: hypothetical protein E7Z89_04730 [Cyanobacteria bacterium SIG28]|nr:hypothetical protein [Cyanobacteria bacterium SIG28]